MAKFPLGARLIRSIILPDCQLLKRLFSECVSHSFGYP